MKRNDKLFIVRKYVWAQSAQQAIKNERTKPVDDVWMDDDFKKNLTNPANAVGFNHETGGD